MVPLLLRRLARRVRALRGGRANLCDTCGEPVPVPHTECVECWARRLHL